MTDRETHTAFVRSVVANPDDDSIRLVFADFLEEQGGEAESARAEHVRAHCRILGGRATPEERGRWGRREAALVKKHRGHWLRSDGVDPTLLGGVGFHKGFPEMVAVAGGVFLALGSDLFARMPIRHLCLVTAGDGLTPLTVLDEYPEFTRLKTLTVAMPGFGDVHALALARCPHFEGLEQLTVRARRSERAATRILRNRFGARFYLSRWK